MIDDAAPRPHQPSGMGQELIRSRVLPLFIAGRKMIANVAGGNRAEQGIGERMQAGMVLRMRGE